MRLLARLAYVAALVSPLITLGCGGDAPQTGADAPRPRAPSLIPDENARAGDDKWQLDNPAYNHEVEGYGSRITLHAGEGLDVKVNVDKPRAVSWSVFRIGWYGGAGGRRILDGGPVMTAPQPACPRDPVTARIECGWASAFHVDVPKDAPSGVYLIKLAGDDGMNSQQSYVPFVVVDGRSADVLMNINVTSWQSYNDWGGESLYDDASGKMPHGKAWEVSFDRPFNESQGAGRFLYWEVHTLRFLEALGYDVAYTTGIDIAHDPAQVKQANLFLSVANDEYWLPAERTAVEDARNGGVNEAFLGADQALWRIRLEPSSTGAPERVQVCYKADQDKDPVVMARGNEFSTARFRDDPSARPENGLIGVMYDSWMLVPQPLVIGQADHWMFNGTNLKSGDTLPLMVSFETDRRFDNGAEPPGLQTVATSPFVDAEGAPSVSMMTYYRHAGGAEVVGAGTIGWSSGLGDPHFANPQVALITRNIVDRLVKDGRKGAADPGGAPWSKAGTTSVTGAWATRVSTVASQGIVAPAGVAAAADGSVYLSDAPAHVIRRVAPDGSVSTWAGDGQDGSTDGPGAQARFRWPAGLALAKDGTLYVADADNHVIRAIAPDAAHTVSTYAGQAARGGDFLDGPGTAARFNRPIALALAGDGTLLVADMHNNRIRRVDAAAGHAVSTVAGIGIGYADGAPLQASFNNPSGVAVASDGSIYVLDTYNQALRRISADGHLVTTLVGGDGIPGLVDGNGKTARIGAQAGLALLGAKIYLSDVAHDRIRVITPGADAASTSVATFAGDGRAALNDGGGAVASFAAPMGIVAAPDGSLLVADSGNHAIRRITR